MNIGNDEGKFAVALTHASLDKIPPQLRIATGHDEHVMLFLLRVGDVDATIEILTSALTMAETESVVDTLEETRGLVRKEFLVDDANRLKDSLEAAGTSVELVRPIDAGSGRSESTSSAPRGVGSRGRN